MKHIPLFKRIKNWFCAGSQSAVQNQKEVQRLIDEQRAAGEKTDQNIANKIDELLQTNARMLNQIHNTNRKSKH